MVGDSIAQSEEFAEAHSRSPFRMVYKAPMFHLVWYILVGLIAGVIAKSVMHVHMLLIWTIVLGIIGGILGGAVTHLFVPPSSERFHPAGLLLSTLGAIVVLWACLKLGIRFPRLR